MQWKRNKIGLVRDINTLGAVASPKVTPSTDKAHYAKQNLRNDDDALKWEYVNKHSVDQWKRYNHHAGSAAIHV